MKCTHKFIYVQGNTDPIEGFIEKEPTVGKSFFFFGNPKNHFFRRVVTYDLTSTASLSLVTEMDNGWELTTMFGSIYHVLLITEE